MKTVAIASALVAAGLLTACSDAPTAPAAPSAALGAPAEQPSAARSPARQVTLSVRIGQQANATKLIGGMRVTFKNGTDSLQVWDNQAGDVDARLGYIAGKMNVGSSYEARTTGGNPTWYRLDGVKTSSQILAGVVNFDAILLRKSPVIVLKVQDSQYGLPVSGGAFQVYGVDGSAYMWFGDNNVGGFDGNMTVGTLEYPFVGLGTYKICERLTPVNFQPLSPKCFTVNAPELDQTYTHIVKYVAQQYM